MIPIVFFSKELKSLSVPQLIDALHQMRCDGVDLCVREGYPVNPDNVKRELPQAARQFREAGLKIPMISAATDLTDPHLPVVDRLLGACHDAGIALLKPGYWRFVEGDYWQQVDQVRRSLEAWQQKATAQGVRIAWHTHSGYNLGLNAAAMMHLVRGFNPVHTGMWPTCDSC